MKYAWTENNVVKDVCPGNPLDYYHPDIAAYYCTEISDNITNGATLIDGEWVNASVPQQPTVASPIIVSPIEFKLLWTVDERIAIKEMRDSSPEDPYLKDFFEILEDIRLTQVNLSLVSTQQSIDYVLSRLVAIEVISEANVATRRAAILSGIFL